MKKLIIALLILVHYNGFSQKMTQAQIDNIVKLSYASEEIAPAFTNTNTILVVFKGSKKNVNKYLEKDIEKEYKGDYRLLEAGEGLSPADTSKARFFVMVFDKFNSGYFSAGGRVSPETEYQMTMSDRKTGKIYYYKNTSSCYTCLFKEYFKKLEKLRTQ